MKSKFLNFEPEGWTDQNGGKFGSENFKQWQENISSSSSSSSRNSGGTREARALDGTREARAFMARAKHARLLARAKLVGWWRVRSTRWARAKCVRLLASTSTP